MGADLDPGPLREKYAALGRLAEQARRVADGRVALTNESLELADAAARLDPPVADLEALARIPLPRPEDLLHFVDAFEAGAREAREAARAREAVEKEMAETTARLARLAAGRPLATADRIAEARTRRETAWRPLRGALFGAGERASLGDRVAEFERLAIDADLLADEAIEDAARLAQHALETQRLDQEAREYALAQAAEARAAGRLAETQQGWHKLWRPVCAGPRSPARMQEWSGRVEQCLRTRDKLVARRTELEAKEAELRRIEPRLKRAWPRGGVERDRGSRLHPARRSLREASRRDDARLGTVARP